VRAAPPSRNGGAHGVTRPTPKSFYSFPLDQSVGAHGAGLAFALRQDHIKPPSSHE
jgi:hypothetical protein